METFYGGNRIKKIVEFQLITKTLLKISQMNLEQKYRDELEMLRSNKKLLSNYSIDSSKDRNLNQIKRNRILIGLYNDCKPSDYEIADFIFNEEKTLRKSDLEIENYEVEVLYLSAFILTKFDRIDDIWKFIDSKTTDFDSSIGFDTEYLLSFGVDRVFRYLEKTEHPNKELGIKLVGSNLPIANYTQEEIDEWKKFKHDYFLVYEFPIKDEVDFSFQAQEYEHLKSLIPIWKTKKNEWTENQNLTSITIGRVLRLDEFQLESLNHYVKTFKNSVRNSDYKKDIKELEKKLHTTKPIVNTGFWYKVKSLFK